LPREGLAMTSVEDRIIEDRIIEDRITHAGVGV
jgi:hypothetical protein